MNADTLMVRLREYNLGLWNRFDNLNTALDTSRTEVQRPNGELTTFSD